MNTSEQLKRLQDEFVSYVRARDDEGVRRIFRELLDAGCSRQEILTKLLEASGATDQASTEPGSRSEGADAQVPVNGSAQEPATPEPGSQNTPADKELPPAMGPAERSPKARPKLAAAMIQSGQKTADTDEL